MPTFLEGILLGAALADPKTWLPQIKPEDMCGDLKRILSGLQSNPVDLEPLRELIQTLKCSWTPGQKLLTAVHLRVFQQTLQSRLMELRSKMRYSPYQADQLQASLAEIQTEIERLRQREQELLQQNNPQKED